MSRKSRKQRRAVLWLTLAFVIGVTFCTLMCSPSEARGRRGGGGGFGLGALVEGESNSTAQGVAEIMARQNRVGHCGGNRGYEGCGCGASKEAAYAICCYANSGMKTIDVGYAQGSGGMWFCCRRYL